MNSSSGAAENIIGIRSMEAHKVVPPPKTSTIHKLKNRLKETFFPDDPLSQFKGQSFKNKWILAAQYFFPILQWGTHYNFNLFKSDIVSGLTIASLAIPQVPPPPAYITYIYIYTFSCIHLISYFITGYQLC